MQEHNKEYLERRRQEIADIISQIENGGRSSSSPSLFDETPNDAFDIDAFVAETETIIEEGHDDTEYRLFTSQNITPNLNDNETGINSGDSE